MLDYIDNPGQQAKTVADQVAEIDAAQEEHYQIQKWRVFELVQPADNLNQYDTHPQQPERHPGGRLFAVDTILPAIDSQQGCDTPDHQDNMPRRNHRRLTASRKKAI